MLGFECGEFAAVYRPTRPPGNGAGGRQGLDSRRIMNRAKPPVIPKTIVLVGLMGAGKSCIGRRLAAELGLEFVDADAEIEAAAGCAIQDIFDRHGEPAFRDGERRVITRLLDQPVHVLATGGGSFMDPGTRQTIRERAISVWLRADLDLLLKRTSRRNNRPLLKRGDPRRILAGLIAQRYPVYAMADITVDSQDGPPEVTVQRTLAALQAYLAAHPEGRAAPDPPAETGAAR